MDRDTEPLPSPLSVRLLCWLGPLASLLLALQLEFYHMKQAFEETADRTIHQIETKANTFEMAVEGFANFLSIAGNVGDNQVRAYVRGIRKLNPDLYRFEIASRVEQRQRAAFEKAMQTRGYPDFVIHGHASDDEGQDRSVGERPVYYPIRFMEPEHPDAVPVLGLDIGTLSTGLVDTLIESLTSSRARASHPFELPGGGKGYVIYCPVTPPSGNLTTASRLQPLSFAVLAIRAKDLLPAWLGHRNGYSVSLRYPQAPPVAQQVMLTEPVNWDEPGPLSGLVVPFSRTALIRSQSQPFEITLKKSIRGSDFRLGWMLVVMLGGSWLSFALAHGLARMLTEPVNWDEPGLLSGLVVPFSRTAMIRSQSQPFEMTLKKSIRGSDFRLGWMLVVMLGGSWLSFALAHGLARMLHRQARARDEQEQLYRRANFDALTRLPNLNLLIDRARQAVRIADRSGTKVALCYLDLDKFKPINDRWGHDAGDALLVEVADRLRRTLRDQDTAARIHGDEFVVLLPNVTDQPALAVVTGKILSIFDQPFIVAGQSIRLQGSIGSVLFPDEARDLDEMLKISDTRMYAHKQQGGLSDRTPAHAEDRGASPPSRKTRHP